MATGEIEGATADQGRQSLWPRLDATAEVGQVAVRALPPLAEDSLANFLRQSGNGSQAGTDAILLGHESIFRTVDAGQQHAQPGALDRLDINAPWIDALVVVKDRRPEGQGMMGLGISAAPGD